MYYFRTFKSPFSIPNAAERMIKEILNENSKLLEWFQLHALHTLPRQCRILRKIMISQCQKNAYRLTVPDITNLSKGLYKGRCKIKRNFLLKYIPHVLKKTS
jgi:hypothetical protein